MKMNATVTDKSVLITGGTGSFGGAMVRHLLRRDVGEVRIVSRDEAKQDYMRNAVNDSRVRFFIGDTRDAQSLQAPFRGANFVFHAAALKQVPSAEFFPLEAVNTNILGSANVLRASLEAEVESVVCLSTDKAVYPINAMGMTKAVMEKTAQAFARDNLNAKTRISVTRYGNVMFSRGSVIPRFISQIKRGKPVTITDPKMTRFLMSLEESVDLVEHAFTASSTGDLFVRKAPAASIETLSDAVLEIFGAPASAKEVIGFRHGEKLFESLLSAEERALASDEGQYFRVPLDARDLNYDFYFEKGQGRIGASEAYTSHNTRQLSSEEVSRLLRELPEIKEQVR